MNDPIKTVEYKNFVADIWLDEKTKAYFFSVRRNNHVIYRSEDFNTIEETDEKAKTKLIFLRLEE